MDMGWFWLGNVWLLIGLLANHSSDTILVIRYWSLGEARVVVAGDFLELWFGRGRNVWSEFTFGEKEIVFLHINFQFFGILFYEIMSMFCCSLHPHLSVTFHTIKHLQVSLQEMGEWWCLPCVENKNKLVYICNFSKSFKNTK